MMGWQPIETAPKDGTVLLLHVPYPMDRPYFNEKVAPPHITFGFFGKGHPDYGGAANEWFSIEFETETFHGSELTGSWDEHYFIRVHPTHWVPLPEPPVCNASGEI